MGPWLGRGRQVVGVEDRRSAMLEVESHHVPCNNGFQGFLCLALGFLAFFLDFFEVQRWFVVFRGKLHSGVEFFHEKSSHFLCKTLYSGTFRFFEACLS